MLRPVVCVLFVGACGVPDPVRQQIADGSKGPVDSPPASGTGAPAAPVDEDEDGVVAADDCDDGDATVFPGAPELCDGRDNDCDGGVDNGLAASVGATGYGSLQAAIDAALAEVPSPPVAVCPPGEVPEALATVALTGAQSLTVTGSVPTAPPVLASADGASLFTVTDRASLHLEQVALQGTRAGAPAVSVTDGGTLTATTVWVRDNEGPGLRLSSAEGPRVSATLTDVRLLRNHAGDGSGGGLSVVGDVALTCDGCRVRDNEAARGGGVSVQADDGAMPSVTLTASEIAGNRATVEGGGLHVAHGGATEVCQVTLDGTTVADNEGFMGGGLFLTADLVGVLRVVGFGTVEIRDNEADVDGGGIYTDAGALVGLHLTGNAAARGGGVHARGGAEAIKLSDVSLDGNSASEGGGLHVDTATAVTLSGTSTVINNTAGVGGGAFLEAEEDAELDCRGVAWGTPLTDDNGPHDIWLAGPDRAVNFDGASSTFLCNADVCD